MMEEAFFILYVRMYTKIEMTMKIMNDHSLSIISLFGKFKSNEIKKAEC